jgi:thioester reductase-like protein/pimeloyl-ACP methyl ester carboxylesterase
LKILLTGATGFLGQSILASLLKQQHEVFALIRPQGERDAAARLDRLLVQLDVPIDAAAIAIEGDLSQAGMGLSVADRERLFNVDVIVHAGSPANIDLTVEEARRNVLEGTAELLELATAVHQKRGLQRFVHLVGYMSPWQEDNIDMSLDVRSMDSFMRHIGPYERAKVLADLLVRQTATREGFPLTVIHPGAVIGSKSSGHTERLSGFCQLVDSIRRGIFPFVPGGSAYQLPLVSVDDIAHYTAALCNWPEAANKTYYLLDGTGPNMRELVDTISSELRLSQPLVSLPMSLMVLLTKIGSKFLPGVSPYGMDYVTNQSYPVETVEHAQHELQLEPLFIRESLPFVIADVDYRLGRKQAADTGRSFGLQRERRGRLAALVRSGEGIPWVILHGMYGSADDFLPFVEAIPEDDPVLLLDLPGFGRSPVHHEHEILQGHVQSVRSALAEIKGPVRLVGHSFGALVAFEVAKSSSTQVAQLFLMQPPLKRPKMSLLLRSPLLAKLAMRFAVPSHKFAKKLIEWGAFEAESDVPLDYVERVQADLRSPRIRAANAEVLSFLSTSFTGMNLSDIQHVPTKILWGTQLPHAHQFPISHPQRTVRELLT